MPKTKCSSCQFKQEDPVVLCTDTGLFYMTACAIDITRVKIVDPDAERYCETYRATSVSRSRAVPRPT